MTIPLVVKVFFINNQRHALHPETVLVVDGLQRSPILLAYPSSLFVSRRKEIIIYNIIIFVSPPPSSFHPWSIVTGVRANGALPSFVRISTFYVVVEVFDFWCLHRRM